MTYAIFIALLLRTCSSTETFTSAAAWEARSLALLQDTTKSPVEKVAKLLTDMSKTLEEDAKSDEEVNEGMNCWCKTSKASKAKTIKDNTEKVATLQSSIQQLTAKSNKLNTELDDLTAKLESDQKELDTAIELRKTETEEFTAAEKSTVADIESLGGASAALKQGMQHSMLQENDDGVSVDLGEGSPVATGLRKALRNHNRDSLLWSIHDAAEKRILKRLMEQTEAEGVSLIQTGTWSLNAPFDVIHGAIQSMQATFQENLDSLQEKEESSAAAHAAMKKAKQEEIKAGMAMIDNKRELLADTDEQRVAEKEDLHDTNKALEVDNEYLQNVNEQCALHEKEYAVRVKTRQEELHAVNGALEVLTGDDAKDLFTSTLGHSKGGEKLGSRDDKDIQEWREDREVTSKRSQLNAARKKRYGTVKRGVALLQKDSTSRGIAFLQVHEEVKSKHNHPDAEKLKTLEQRTEAYWAAHYSMAALKPSNLSPHERSTRTASPTPVASPQRSLRHQLGLTSERAMVQAMEPSLKDKVHKMQEDLKLQQAEETAKYDWCKNERIDLEKKNSTADRDVDRAKTKLKTLNVELKEIKEELKDLKNEQADADVELQLASNTRRKTDSEYQQSTMNQIATQQVLKKALQFLENFYKKKSAASFLSERIHAFNTEATLASSAKAAVLASSAMLDESEKDEYDGNREGNILREGQIANLRIEGQDLITKPAPGSEDSDELPYSAGAQDNLAASWLQRYAPDSPVSFLQLGRHAPGSSTAQLLKEAEESNAEAEKSFAAARALLRQQHQTLMIQQSNGEPAGPPPPSGFKSYEGNRASGGALLMIQNLIDDSEAMVKEAAKAETDALTEYEKFVQETNDVTDERQKAIVDREARVGKLEEFIEEARLALKEAIDEKARLRQRDIDLHAECDYLIKNYLSRKEARTQEIENLIMAGPMINNMAGEFDDNSVIKEKGGGIAGQVGAPNEQQRDLMSDAFLKNSADQHGPVTDEQRAAVADAAAAQGVSPEELSPDEQRAILKKAAAEGRAKALPAEAMAAAAALDKAQANRVVHEEHPEGVEIFGKGGHAVVKMNN